MSEQPEPIQTDTAQSGSITGSSSSRLTQFQKEIKSMFLIMDLTDLLLQHLAAKHGKKPVETTYPGR